MASRGPPQQGLSNSGIKKLSNGDSVIPSSTRADGSVRKEIRVKPGYKPPEDVAVYKNRTAEAWKNRGNGGVLGADPVDSQEPSLKVAAAAAKNAKRREARKKASAATAAGEDEPGSTSGEALSKKNGDDPIKNGQDVKEEIDEEAEKSKEARKLAKKLRQARELQDKKEKDDSLLPEQFAKVIKIQELIRQLDGLGFDADGEKKSSDTAAG